MTDSPTSTRLRQALPGIAVLVAGAILVLLLPGGGGGGDGATPAATARATTAAFHLPTMTLTPVPATPVTPAPTATATSTSAPSPTQTPTPVTAKEVEVKPEPVKLEPGAVIPVSLELAGRYFAIVPTTLRADAWAYLPDPGRISWLAGSYVDVVLGLPYTGDNLDLVTVALALSDTLTLRTSVGGANAYQVVERKSVGVYEIEALSQRRAGLTLVLLGGNEESPDRRIVVWAVPADVERREEERMREGGK